jgi:hypothetical protein
MFEAHSIERRRYGKNGNVRSDYRSSYLKADTHTAVAMCSAGVKIFSMIFWSFLNLKIGGGPNPYRLPK